MFFKFSLVGVIFSELHLRKKTENHVAVGELMERKASQHIDMNTPKSMPTDISWNPDSEASQVTGGYSISFSLTVLQVICLYLSLNLSFSGIDTMDDDLLKFSLKSYFLIPSLHCVTQSECQQLICEILRATPEAASADAAVQTARLASKAPAKDKRQVKIKRSLEIFWQRMKKLAYGCGDFCV